jgi:hypothetical protein
MREPHEKFGPALDALIAAQSCRQLAPKADARPDVRRRLHRRVDQRDALPLRVST